MMDPSLSDEEVMLMDEQQNDILVLEEDHALIDLQNELIICSKKFRRACRQLLILNEEIDCLQCRYERAEAENQRSFRYSLRLRIATLEGVRDAYQEYAIRISHGLQGLQAQRIIMDLNH